MAFQPVPSYAEVSYSTYDKATGKTISKFNPVWLSWFLTLSNQSSPDSGEMVTSLSFIGQGEVVVGADGTRVVAGIGSNGNPGDVLSSQGPGNPPLWSPGGGLGAYGNNSILSNISGGVAPPLGNSLTAVLDSIVGNARGSMLTRTNVGWVALAPGAAGTKLTSNGAGADLSWV